MLLALSICDSYVFPLATKHPGYNLLPGVIPNLWMGRHCLGLALKVLYTDSASVPRVDKIMVILVHLSQRIEDVNVGVEMLIDMPLYGLSKRLDNPLEKFNLADGVQVMCHTATLCPHPTLRLAVYRLLSRFFDLCDPEAQVMVLYEMTQGEKSSPVLEAAVRLLKDRIAYAFDNKEDHLHAMYHSTMVTDKFFDIIFRKPSAEHLMTLTGYYMQALNMYQFLLMRDNENEVSAKGFFLDVNVCVCVRITCKF
ncbi:hypothetical protein BX666DRAFT_1025635 [Dichotomocladium elegans]|nr:hypothetical protein BX666DRAFT_1025635 [Dichotomocladium elegans]